MFKRVRKTKIAGIYTITNGINNKRYVGQSVDLEYRLWQHENRLSNNRHENPHLQKSWNKYGKISFSFDIIEITESLFERETYWIKKWKTKNQKFGYNICEPNSPYTGHAKKVSQIDKKTLSVIKNWTSAKDACIAMTNGKAVNGSAILSAIKNHHSAYGFYWSETGKPIQLLCKNTYRGSYKSSVVCRRNIFNGNIETWRSTNQARIALGVTGKGNISYWCGKQKVIDGYEWYYEKDGIPVGSTDSYERILWKHRPLSEETKQKLRILNSGENHPQYGLHKSLETKRKISLAHMKNKTHE